MWILYSIATGIRSLICHPSLLWAARWQQLSTLFHLHFSTQNLATSLSTIHPSIHPWWLQITTLPSFLPVFCVLEWSHFKQAANMFQLKLRSQLVWRRRRKTGRSRKLLKLRMKNSLLILFTNFFLFFNFFPYLQGFLVILIEDILIICILCCLSLSHSLSLCLLCKFSQLKKKINSLKLELKWSIITWRQLVIVER